MNNGESRAIAQDLKTQLTILCGLLALMWIIEIADVLIFQPQGLNRGTWGLDIYGIMPRNLTGLRGILFAPFLHGNFGHLIANTVPFLILGWLVMLRETRDFFWVTVISALVSGLGTWLIAAPRSVHIGASGVIFGYLGYLLARGFFERSAVSVAIALGVVSLYGSMIWGVLPLHPFVSWQMHLFGFLGGILAARLLVPDKASAS